MSDLKCANCGQESSYADASISDSRKTCGSDGKPDEIHTDAGMVKYAWSGDEHVWVEVDEDDSVIPDLPDGRVYRFSFEVSHAPHYVAQLANGAFVATYAHVEFADEEEPKAWGVNREKVVEHIEAEHVDVEIVPEANSPFGGDE